MNVKIDIESSYQQFGPMVYRRCLKILNNEAQAMDAMQDVFMQLIKKQHELENQGMSSLLYRMATNISLNVIRHQKVRDEHAAQMDLPEPAEHMEDRAIDHDQLMRVLSQCDQRTREAAIYHYMDGFTMDEVAQMMTMSNSNVRRLLRELRSTFAQRESV